MVISRQRLPLFVLSLLLPQLVGAVGSFFTLPQIAKWYFFLDKPLFSPPNWVFGPVWTILYIMMGISFFLVVNQKMSKKIVNATQVFFLQLFLNLLWSIVFFGMRSTGGGLIVIIALWVAILMTILMFSRISKNAALLLLPYLAWVTFACFLNLALFQLNM